MEAIWEDLQLGLSSSPSCSIWDYWPQLSYDEESMISPFLLPTCPDIPISILQSTNRGRKREPGLGEEHVFQKRVRREGPQVRQSRRRGGVKAPALNTDGTSRAKRGAATDPQSVYARQRRERINSRLRTLQTLVPNGPKVDILSMLDETIKYVKFLELQLKFLQSDELWMFTPTTYNGFQFGTHHPSNYA